MKIQVPLSRVWIALPIISSLIVAFVQRLRPHDYWWHLAMGRYFSETGNLPTTNLFLFTRPLEEPFFNQPWLGQWLMFHMHEFGGPIAGVIFLAVSCLVFTLFCLNFLREQSVSPRVASVVAIFSLAAAKPIFSVRTRMFAIIPLVLISTILFRFRNGKGSIATLYWIPLITVFWANTHGSFVVSVVLVWLLVADFIWQRLFGDEIIPNSKLIATAIVGFLTTLAGCVHPFGIRVYGYVYHLALQSDVGATVSEWQPLSIQQPTGIFVFLLFLISLFLLVRYGRKEITLFSVLAFSLAVYLGFSAERSLLFFAGIIPFVISPFLPKAKIEEVPSRVETWVNSLIILALICLLLISFPLFTPKSIAALMPPTRDSGIGKGVLSDENISPDSIRGARRVFHEQGIGGQVEWILDSQAAFVDQRMEYIPQSVWDEYELVSSGQNGWQGILKKYEVDTLVVHRLVQKDLVLALKDNKLFYEKGQDGPYTIYSLDGFENPLKQDHGNRDKDDIDNE